MKRNKNSKFIVFRCALNYDSGLGHVKRCINVAKLISSKFTPLFIVPNYAKSHTELLVKNNLNFRVLPENANLLEEVNYYPTNTSGVVIDITDNHHKSKENYFIITLIYLLNINLWQFYLMECLKTVFLLRIILQYL